jgi:hypothetical protein
VDQHSSLKQELERAMMDAKEKVSTLHVLGAELEELRRMRPREEPNADESQKKMTRRVWRAQSNKSYRLLRHR